MAINRVVLVGRLTKDVELRATNSGLEVASFTIAVDNYTKDSANGANSASFISCVAWDQRAKFLSTYCKKGNLVAVEGRLQTRTYDRKDGSKAYVTEVVADRVENLSPKEGKATEADEGFSMNEEDNDIASSYSDEDLPF